MGVMTDTKFAILLTALVCGTPALAQDGDAPAPEQAVPVPFDEALLTGAQRAELEAQREAAEERGDEHPELSVDGPTLLRLRSLEDQLTSTVPFGDVAPLDRGFGTVLDPANAVGPQVIPYEALAHAWFERGLYWDPAQYRTGQTRRLGYFDDTGRFREVRNIDDFPGFGVTTYTFTSNPRVPGSAIFAFDRNDTVRQRVYDRYSDAYASVGRFDFGGSSTSVFGSYRGINLGRLYDSSGYAYTGSRSTYAGIPLLELPGKINYTILLAQPEKPEPEPVDPALEAIADGAFTRAASVYLSRDEEREDASDRASLRLAAVMLALDGQIDRAARHLGEAIEAHPELRDTRVDADALGIESKDLTSAQYRISRQATRSDDPTLWALAATLADARGSSTGPRLWKRYDKERATE